MFRSDNWVAKCDCWPRAHEPRKLLHMTKLDTVFEIIEDSTPFEDTTTSKVMSI
jgi:hypothetical protein